MLILCVGINVWYFLAECLSFWKIKMYTESSVCTEACRLIHTWPLVGRLQRNSFGRLRFRRVFPLTQRGILPLLPGLTQSSDIWCFLSCIWSPRAQPLCDAGFLESHPPICSGNAGGSVLWGAKGRLVWAFHWLLFQSCLPVLGIFGILWHELICLSLAFLFACT